MSQKTGLVISVTKGKDKLPVKRSGPTVNIQGRPVPPKSGRAVDIVFVIDTTGSMSDKIQGLLETCRAFVDRLAGFGLLHKLAVIAFGDLTVPGDEIRVYDFSESIEGVRATLSNVPRYGGGGNEGESSLEALDRALSLSFRQDSVKVIILITDEPALQHQHNPQRITARMKEREILTFVVSPPETYYKEMADRTGGTWFQISSSTDFRSILDMFNNLAAGVSRIVNDVYSLGRGSVSQYLRLKGR